MCLLIFSYVICHSVCYHYTNSPLVYRDGVEGSLSYLENVFAYWFPMALALIE